ncbi:hypothetical protein DNTS_020595, partial [Danionella cerebrum]
GLESSLEDEGQCNIEIRDAKYAYAKPVIIRGLTDNTKFRFLCSKSNLLREFSNKTVRLSTANTHSYRKGEDAFVCTSHSLYFFGDNNFTEWGSLFEEYEAPPYSLPLMHQAYSFGIAGAGTGVPFHWHGPGYSEVIYGRKRWFLFPPDETPEFHPNHTSLSWVSMSYPNLELQKRPLECTIRPGEVLYFPDRWWHATLNLDTSVFISTFLG